MMKKIFSFFLVVTICETVYAKEATPLLNEDDTGYSLENLTGFVASAFNEIEYWWVLDNDGCYHLYRVEVVGGQLEFWTPLGWWNNYHGSTTNCVFTQEQMDVMC
jgi:hypothetical protein